MSNILVGRAYWLAELQHQQLTQGVAEVERQIARLQQLSKQPITFTARGQVSPAGGGGGGGAGGGGGGAGGDGLARYDRLQRAQASLLASEARLARAQGDTAKAAELEAAAQLRLTTVLESQSGVTLQSIATQKQLVSVQTQSARAAQQHTTATQASGGALDLLGKAAIVAGGAFAAIRVGQQAFELARYGAALNDTRVSFDGLSRAAGTTSAALLAGMRTAARGSIADAKLMESANLGLLLTNGKIAGQLPQLIEIARASARATGQDIGFIYDSLVRGIARGSPQIIDNAGITLDAAAAFDTYAKSIGTTSDKLTGEQQQQATLNAVLETGAEIIKRTGAAAGNQADSYTRLTVAMTNLKDRGASQLGTVLAPVAEGLNDILSVTDGTAQGFGGAAVAVNNFSRHLTGLPQLTDAQAAATRNMAEQIATWLGFQTAATAETQKLAAIEEDRASRRQGDVVNLQQMTSAQLGYANALELTGVQARAAAVVQQQKADADQVAAVNAQTAQVAQQQLADAAQKAARALIASGDDGARSAALLADSSQQVDVLTAAYYRLFTAQDQAAPKALTPEQQGLKALRDSQVMTAEEISDANVRAMLKAQAEAKRLADAQLAYNLAHAKTAGQRIAILQKELAGTTDQAERLQLMTRIESERASAAREGQRLAKAHTSELNKQLTLEEGIRDSKEKQLKATLDAQEAIIKDRQERRKEDQEIRAAQRILASGRSSAAFRAAAADRLALIDIQRQQRALAIGEQQATAGASIIGGRLIQSRPTSGGRSPSLAAGAPGAPGVVSTTAAAPEIGGAAAAAGVTVDVAVYLDSTPIAAKVVTTLREGHRAVPSAGVGQAVPTGG